jgi:hypothetical protein
MKPRRYFASKRMIFWEGGGFILVVLFPGVSFPRFSLPSVSASKIFEIRIDKL